MTILAIRSDNTTLHLYPDLTSVFTSQRFGGSGQVEYFEVSVRTEIGVRSRLPVFGAGEVVDRQETDDRPDLTVLLQRMRDVIQHVRAVLKDHPEIVKDTGRTVKEALEELPQLEGRGFEE